MFVCPSIRLKFITQLSIRKNLYFVATYVMRRAIIAIKDDFYAVDCSLLIQSPK